MESGDIYIAGLSDERRRRVLVVSSSRFNRLAERALVAPELGGPLDEVSDPWRIGIEGGVFAVDFTASLPTERLLERVGRAPADAVLQVRRALLAIT